MTDNETEPSPAPKGTVVEKLTVKDNIRIVLTDTRTGKVKRDIRSENLQTDVGDSLVAKRLYDDAQDPVSGMRLGTDRTDPSKNGAGAAIVAYIAGSSQVLSFVQSFPRGDGLGSYTEYRTIWPPGVVTNTDINEVALTTETPIADVSGNEADTAARFLAPSTLDKQPDDQLEVIWRFDFLAT